MDFNELSDELKAKAKSAQSTEELLALAESEGIKLSAEELEAFSGGSIWSCSCNDCDEDNALGD